VNHIPYTITRHLRGWLVTIPRRRGAGRVRKYFSGRPEAEAWALQQMVKTPAYMQGIPLAAETGCGVRYGDAKN
jgi:hypothetical protein